MEHLLQAKSRGAKFIKQEFEFHSRDNEETFKENAMVKDLL